MDRISRIRALWGLVALAAWIALAPTPGMADINDGLVLFLPLDGDAVDESGNGNHGTLFGTSPTLDRYGNPGSALQLNGVNNYIAIPSSRTLDITGPLAISLWILPADAGTNLPVSQYLVSKGTGPYFDTGNNTYSLFLSDPTNASGSITFELSRGGPRNFTPDAAPLRVSGLERGVWYHLAATWDGVVMRVYLNGLHIVEVDTPFAGPINSRQASLNIGRLGNVTGHFKGSLDDLRIYDRALTSEEVQVLFFGRLDCPADARYTEEDLVAAYQNGYADGLAEGSVGSEALCASYGAETGRLHIPCLSIGEDRYWADLLLFSADPVEFRLDGFGATE